MKIIHRNFCLFLFYFIFPLNLEYVVMKGISSVLAVGCFDGSGFFFFFFFFFYFFFFCFTFFYFLYFFF